MKRIFKISGLMAIFTVMLMSLGHANWRDGVGVFRIGVVSQQEVGKTIRKFETFTNVMSAALKMDVEIFPAKNEARLIQALAADRIEYAILSSTGYALSWVLCECVEPLVSARQSYGGDSYHTVLITSVNGASKPAELVGKPVGAMNENSVSGHPFAKFLLAEDGISLDTADSPFIFNENGLDTLKAFQSGSLDGLIGWSSMNGDPSSGFTSGTLRQLARLNDGDAKPYRIIWNSPLLPIHPHVISKKLNSEAKLILRSTLESLFDRYPVAYDTVEPEYGGGFVVSRHSRFLPLIRFVESIYEQSAQSSVPSGETVGSVNSRPSHH